MRRDRWVDFIRTYETDAPGVHVNPNYERQKHHGKEGAEDRRLCHIVLFVEESETENC